MLYVIGNFNLYYTVPQHDDKQSSLMLTKYHVGNEIQTFKQSDSLSLKSQYFLAANTSDAISRCKGSILNWSLTIISKRGWMKLRSYLLDFASDLDKICFPSPETQHRITFN